ncbi:PEP-CTERM sorting domain-containing protein [Sphingomonas lenta]|nr:PEP-CTERM sorting domain-containing protein [Sphingomonas lenta]
MLPLLASATTPRTAPEPSDLFLFAAAVLAVWFVRRSLRKRFRDRGPK